VQLYRRCIGRWEEHPQAAASVKMDLASLLERAAEVAHLADDTEAAIDLVRRAIALTDAAAEPARVGILHQRLGEYLWQHGSEAESLEMTSRAFTLVPPDGSAARARVVSAWGNALNLVSRYGEALEAVEEAVRIGRTISDAGATSMSLAVRGLAHSNLDDLASGMRDLTEALELARGSSDPAVQAFVYLDASWAVGIVHGDPRMALEIIADWEELQRQSELERTRGMWLAGVAAAMNMRLGRWEEADTILMSALPQLSRGPARIELLENAGLLRVWQGRVPEAAAIVDELMALVRTMIGQPIIGSNYAVAIELAVWSGDPATGVALLDEARDRLLSPDDPVQTRHLYAVGLRACADQVERLRAARRATGTEIAELRERAADICRLARYPDLPNLTARQPETQTWAAQGEAELLRIDASSSEAEAWRTVADSWSALGFAALEAYGRWREAAAWFGRGDRTAAATALEAGHARAASVGAGAARSSLERLAARARLRLLSVSDERADERERRWGLTAREAEVLALVARGMSNRQIAGELYVTEKTASVHVSNILAKLDVRSRAHAAAIAVQSGSLSA
jgi:DNA-binding CsgD family transcriptional regulator